MDAKKVETKIFPWLPLASLILVALSVLAVIAINSREGNIRSKVSGVRQNLANFERECAASIHTSNRFPFAVDRSRALQPFPAVFAARIGERANQYDSFQFNSKYYFFALIGDVHCIFINTGPDRRLDLGEADLQRLGRIRKQKEYESQLRAFCYDPSNGTRSGGDIIRWSDFLPR